MMVAKNYLGATFGKYKVIGIHPERDKHDRQLYYAFCTECESVYCKPIGIIKAEGIHSCIHWKHTWKNKRLSGIFRAMKDRCYNSNCPAYRNYGKKGVVICDEWLHSSKNFEEWAMLNGYTDTLTIDRQDANKGYSPENCSWVSKSENSQRTSKTNFININGVIDSAGGWSRSIGRSENWFSVKKKKYGYDEALKMLTNLVEPNTGRIISE